MAARREGRPARISIAIMNSGTPVSTAAAAPPATVSGDQPRDIRRVRTASNAQTKTIGEGLFDGPHVLRSDLGDILARHPTAHDGLPIRRQRVRLVGDKGPH